MKRLLFLVALGLAARATARWVTAPTKALPPTPEAWPSH